MDISKAVSEFIELQAIKYFIECVTISETSRDKSSFFIGDSDQTTKLNSAKALLVAKENEVRNTTKQIFEIIKSIDKKTTLIDEESHNVQAAKTLHELECRWKELNENYVAAFGGHCKPPPVKDFQKLRENAELTLKDNRSTYNAIKQEEENLLREINDLQKECTNNEQRLLEKTDDIFHDVPQLESAVNKSLNQLRTIFGVEQEFYDAENKLYRLLLKCNTGFASREIIFRILDENEGTIEFIEPKCEFGNHYPRTLPELSLFILERLCGDHKH